MTQPDGGYEGIEEEDEDGEPVTYFFERYEFQHAIRGIHCRILRNGEAVGIIRVANERELDFLKERIDGTLHPTA